MVNRSLSDRNRDMDMIERAARALAEMDTERDIGWRYYVPEARAVLEAIREPSEAMIDAHIAAKDMHDDRDGQAYVDWQAMIDTALNPPAQKEE
jgi:hypothetical protein